jgi:hypothetical protein
MKFRGGEFSTGTMRNFQPDLTQGAIVLAGIPIERVAVLLGHQSVRVTEKHYSPLGLRASATIGSGFRECVGQRFHRTNGVCSYAAVTRQERAR